MFTPVLIGFAPERVKSPRRNPVKETAGGDKGEGFRENIRRRVRSRYFADRGGV
jgi:hypothetical protein